MALQQTNEPGEIILSRATSDDVPALAKMRVRFLAELLGPAPAKASGLLQAALEQYFADGLDNDSCINYVAKANDEIVGMGSLVVRQQPGSFKNPSGKVGYILNMYTLPQYRKKGIGSSILSMLEDTARAAGITAFELHATKDGALLYEQAGFSLHSEPTYRKYIS